MKSHKTRAAALLLICILIICLGAAPSIDRRVQTLETQVRSLLRRVAGLEKKKLASVYPKYMDLAKRIDALEKRPLPSGPPTPKPKPKPKAPTVRKGFGPVLEMGQIAYLNGTHDIGHGSYRADAWVKSIIDITNMIVVITVDYRAHNPTRYTPITTNVWVKGLNTVGLVDNSKLEYSGLLKATGTKTYTTVSGTGKTVFVLEPYRE